MSDEAVRLQGMIPPHLKVRQSKILLDSLEVMTDIGFHDFEVGRPQRLLISIELWLEDFAAPPADDPVHAWNYDYLKNEVTRIAQERRYNLQESLVHAIFERVAAYRGVKALRIKSVKPDIYPDAKGVGVEIASFAGETP
ncbi:MAG: dihydroneopterin aldolase [Pseudomonadota bacterium]|nr:dihydroneopterin aldolase [Pseudomonadota bacterium]